MTDFPFRRGILLEVMA